MPNRAYFGTMGIPAAIIAGALIIAAAIVFSARWSIVPATVHNGVYRLDRWTGSVVWCLPSAAPSVETAGRMNCQATQ
jgi:hypothetical protein